MVFQNIQRFKSIPGFNEVIQDNGAWNQSNRICALVNKLSEELVEPDRLKSDRNRRIATLGRILETYQQILSENNLMDFSSIQTEAYRMLKNYDDLLYEIQDKIRYIMIDEYQDTNYVQE